MIEKVQARAQVLHDGEIRVALTVHIGRKPGVLQVADDVLSIWQKLLAIRGLSRPPLPKRWPPRRNHAEKKRP